VTAHPEQPTRLSAARTMPTFGISDAGDQTSLDNPDGGAYPLVGSSTDDLFKPISTTDPWAAGMVMPYLAERYLKTNTAPLEGAPHDNNPYEWGCSFNKD
jgi:hypothetical protein